MVKNHAKAGIWGFREIGGFCGWSRWKGSYQNDKAGIIIWIVSAVDSQITLRRHDFSLDSATIDQDGPLQSVAIGGVEYAIYLDLIHASASRIDNTVFGGNVFFVIPVKPEFMFFIRWGAQMSNHLERPLSVP